MEKATTVIEDAFNKASAEEGNRMTYDCEKCHWDKQKAQHFKDCPCKCHESLQSFDDIPRCEKCSWPLAKSVEEGCVPGNCSMRPVPKKHAEDSVIFWSDKYEQRTQQFFDLHGRCVKAECDLAAANKKIREMEAVIYAVGDYASNHKDDRFGSRRRLLEAYSNYENLKYDICSICRQRHPNDDRHPCE